MNSCLGMAEVNYTEVKKNKSEIVLVCSTNFLVKNMHEEFKSAVAIQSRFSAYCLISASKNYSTKDLGLHSCTATSIDYFLWLLKITGYQECYLFFKLIKHVFLLTETLN